MREATNMKQRAAMVLQALVLAGLFVVAALSAGEQAHETGNHAARGTGVADVMKG